MASLNIKYVGAKKLSFKMLISLISNHHHKNHKKLLIKEFLDWKEDNEQTDDVSVFGLTDQPNCNKLWPVFLMGMF